ncbi:MAG TPA: Rieske (2Fe-2S) protein [Blastocatellia bacterium]|nr:Rieske (2Fe-2S) protein [Blastocatellia bacterium]
MLVITFDTTEYNFIIAGEESYFLLQLSDGSKILLRDRCPHRGGPLHLGHWDNDAGCLVCPWHQSRYQEKTLRKRAIPLVCRNGQATAILDELPDVPVRLLRKKILVKPC